jgi:hypothetical protein
VDLEDLFHSFGIRSPYENPRTWDDAPSCVVADTETLMRMLDNAGVRGTFLALVWIAERHPDLIRRLAREGHEIGCHTHYHRWLCSGMCPGNRGTPSGLQAFPSATLRCGRFLFYAATASRSIFQSCQHAGIMAE